MGKQDTCIGVIVHNPVNFDSFLEKLTSTVPKSYSVYVLDNGSSLPSFSYLKTLDKINLYRVEEKMDIKNAINSFYKTIRNVANHIIFFKNNGIELEKGWHQKTVEQLRSGETCVETPHFVGVSTKEKKEVFLTAIKSAEVKESAEVVEPPVVDKKPINEDGLPIDLAIDSPIKNEGVIIENVYNEERNDKYLQLRPFVTQVILNEQDVPFYIESIKFPIGTFGHQLDLKLRIDVLEEDSKTILGNETCMFNGVKDGGHLAIKFRKFPLIQPNTIYKVRISAIEILPANSAIAIFVNTENEGTIETKADTFTGNVRMRIN